nr:hypothetical protein [Thetidibacter halocola]
MQTRLAQALERIGRTVEGYEPPGAAPMPVAEPPPAAAPEADPEELRALQEALDEERLANAQLEERVRLLKARTGEGGDTAALREQIAAQREAVAGLDAEMQRLRQANDALREVSQALREANAKGVGEPHLINKAILAELDSLRAARAVDAAEAQALMSALTPILAEAAGSHGQEESV